MKGIKKILAVMVAMVMTLGLTATNVFAEAVPTPEDGFTVTITPNSDDKGTHSYEAYQIFAGELAKDADNKLVLSNIVWGSGITDAGKDALGDAVAYANALTDANALTKADQLSTYLAATSGTYSNGQIKGLQPGYYLIKDASGSPSGTDPKAQTRFILTVVADSTVNVKSSVPSVVKKVQDINDSDDEPTLSSLQDSADYDIGDTIPYTVTGTIGTGIDNFTAYSFQFVDNMSKGLTLDESTWDIKVETKSIKSLFNLTSTAGADGSTIWTWAATDIKAEVSDGANVVLTYKCVLNKDAVIGSAGNPNTVKLKYDNNPNNCGKGTPEGETPEDKNIVFTYKTVFNKVDSDKKPLTGADFKLEKLVNGKWEDVTTLGSGENKPYKTTNATETSGATQFAFSGLDDGKYKLTETITPAGYNTIDPIEFTITAEHDILSDNPALTSLTGTHGTEFTMTPNVSEGSLTAAIENQQGATLPSTGGIGTTIFYAIGSILVVGAGVLLISKKRMFN